MSGLEVAQGIGYAKSTLIAIVEAKGRYELIEGIVKDAPDYRQRLSDLENVLGQVHRVFSDSLDILNANKEMRQSLVRGLRNCRDPISEINKKLMSINAKRTHPERLYKASEWKVKLSQHHTKLDSAKLTLLTAMNTINMDMTKYSHIHPVTDRVTYTLTFFQQQDDNMAKTMISGPDDIASQPKAKMLIPLQSRARWVGIRAESIDRPLAENKYLERDLAPPHHSGNSKDN